MSKNRILLIFLYILALAPIFGLLTIKFISVNFWNIATLITIPFFLISLTKKKVEFPTYLLFFSLFTLYTIISDAIIINASIFNLEYLLKNKYILSILILTIVENTKIKSEQLKTYVKTNFIIFLLGFILLFYQTFSDITLFGIYSLDFLGTLSEEEIRLGSIYQSLESIEIGFMPIAILTIFAAEFWNRDNKILATLFLILELIISFLYKSRWLILNVFIILIGITTEFKFRSIKKHLGLLVILILLGFTLQKVYQNSTYFSSVVNNRILEEDNGGFTQGSASTRILAFQIFFQTFPENPLFGKGRFHMRTDLKEEIQDKDLDRLLKGKSSQIHVGYLSLLYYYGVFGAVLFFISMFYLGKKLKTEYRMHKNIGTLLIFYSFIMANFTLVFLSLLLTGLFFSIFYSKTSSELQSY